MHEELSSGGAKGAMTSGHGNARRSVTTWPTSGGEARVVSDFALPPEECTARNDTEELDIEALVREAYEIVKAQIEVEEGSTMETGPRGSEDAEEDASLHTKDEAYAEAERPYNGNYGFGTRLPESSCEDFASILEACKIEEEEETSSGAATFHTPVQETPAAGPSADVRPREKNGGGGKAGKSDTEGSTSDGPATLHASFLETTAAGPSACVRPMVKAVVVARRATTASTRERVRSKRPSHLVEKERPWTRPVTTDSGRGCPNRSTKTSQAYSRRAKSRRKRKRAAVSRPFTHRS